MESTLLECKKIRPHAKWGYYRFPDCHNNMKNPKCYKDAQNWDDQTDWLWNKSTVIFPSSYIPYASRNTANISEYVQSRTLEAWRILPTESHDLPIFHYHM